MDMDMTPPSSSSKMNHGGDGMSMMHMTFFWGKRVQILFSNFPGNRGLGLYIVALAAVFAAAALLEFLSLAARRLAYRQTRHRSLGIFLTLLHALQMGLAYLVMLAVMSFNVGVFIAAVAGHAVGFLVAGSGLFFRHHEEIQPSNGPMAHSAKI